VISAHAERRVRGSADEAEQLRRLDALLSEPSTRGFLSQNNVLARPLIAVGLSFASMPRPPMPLAPSPYPLG
jgi:hypothetical protein